MTRTATPGAVFSELAPVWRDDADRASRIARRVVRHARVNGRVLDVGCGTGFVLSKIRAEATAQNKRLGRTIGIDVAEGMVDRARYRRGVRALPADAVRLPFIDQVFDVVLATDVARFIDDPDRFVRELFRVTMPGGTILIELVDARHSGRPKAKGLPRTSLLRQYLDLRRSSGVAEVRNTLLDLGCDVREWLGRSRPVDHDPSFLAKVGRYSGTPEDLIAVKRMTRMERSDSRGRSRAHMHAPRSVVLLARAPGPRTGAMPIKVKDLPGWSPGRVHRLLAGLPQATGYTVLVKPLRWRTRPHVQAFCDFVEKQIIIQVPQPFLRFWEPVPYRAKRVHKPYARKMRFKWYMKKIWFERPDELIRYLYLHEYYHWYLREVRGKRSGAETACDRFALQQLGRARRRR
ncbi:MAG: class I SAM-dependent methyltransferase [Actinomycetota bacterium]